MLGHVRLFASSWTAACWASLSMEFSRLEYWSGLAFPSPGDLPDLEVEPMSPALQADFLSRQGSPIHIHICPLFWISFPFINRSPQNTE